MYMKVKSITATCQEIHQELIKKLTDMFVMLLMTPVITDIDRSKTNKADKEIKQNRKLKERIYFVKETKLQFTPCKCQGYY